MRRAHGVPLQNQCYDEDVHEQQDILLISSIVLLKTTFLAIIGMESFQEIVQHIHLQTIRHCHSTRFPVVQRSAKLLHKLVLYAQTHLLPFPKPCHPAMSTNSHNPLTRPLQNGSFTRRCQMLKVQSLDDTDLDYATLYACSKHDHVVDSNTLHPALMTKLGVKWYNSLSPPEPLFAWTCEQMLYSWVGMSIEEGHLHVVLGGRLPDATLLCEGFNLVDSSHSHQPMQIHHASVIPDCPI